jgi:ribokinase
MGFEEIPGGKGANQAVAIGKLGGHVTMLGMLGQDSYGEKLIQNLKLNKVNTDYIQKTHKAASGLAMIMVNDDGDNSIVVVSGANFELRRDSISDRIFNGMDYVMAQLEIPIESVEEIFLLAKSKGIKTILNPAPARPISDRLYKNIDILIPNETEFQILTGIEATSIENIRQGASLLFEKGLKELIITLGRLGAVYLHCDGREYKTMSYQVKAIDTTAAGDSFIGALLSRLADGKSMIESIEYGMKVGAITVSRQGAQSSLPTEEEVEDFHALKYIK